MKSKRLTVRVDEELLQRVREVAARQGVSVSFLVDRFLRELIHEHYEDKTDEELGVIQA